MICRGYGIWEENQRLRAEVERLRRGRRLSSR
jgi:hypothetical protein